MSLLPEKIDRHQAKDTGMATVLICLITALVSPQPWLLPLAIALLGVSMIAPRLFTPLAYAWFGLGALLGAIASRVLLTALYALLVVPVGVARRLLGADPLRLRRWKRGEGSLFHTRDHRYQAEDIRHPY